MKTGTKKQGDQAATGECLTSALARLSARHQFGIKFGLDPVRRLCELTGNPQQHFAVVHVAGTNGKGSVCAAIEAVLLAAGFRVGLYTSPHRVRFHERIRINGVEVADEALACALAACETAAEQVRTEQSHEATFFEITTAMAFFCFREAGVQVAVIETGLGGRLDATNIVLPVTSVITRIAMDHEAYLGNTLEAIAREKAGIIKRGRPVVAGPQEEGVETLLRRAAADTGAPYTAASDAVTVRRIGGDLHGQKVHCETMGGWSGTVQFPLAGRHQLENLGIALAALERVLDTMGFCVPFDTVKSGLAKINWRGRFEILSNTPLVIADAAHNPSGAAMLAETLLMHGLSRVQLVTGMCGDKDVAGVVNVLAGIAGHVWTVPISNSRAIDPGRLAAMYKGAGVEADVSVTAVAGLAAAKAAARQTDATVVIAGSIFLLGDVMAGEC